MSRVGYFIDGISGNITWDQIRKKVVEVPLLQLVLKPKIKLLTRKRVDNNTGEKLIMRLLSHLISWVIVVRVVCI